MSGIHLFVPMLHRRDAVGEHTRSLRDSLVAEGVDCRIYVEHPDLDTVEETVPYLRYEVDARPGDVLVYQMATRSDMATWLCGRPEPLVVNYHSLTPAACFAPWNDWIARHQERALADLADLAPRAALGIGVSEFDAEELRRAGYREVTVVPVANVPVPPPTPDPETLDELRRRPGGPRWLSVGRLAPNKGHEDTLTALFVARRTSAPDARLEIVGSPTEPHYARALHRYAAALGLSEAVTFSSRLSAGGLAARYAASDVLVLLSDHEGFGVPLLEAMSHGVPVVAYGAGAVGEVVGEAGVVLDGRAPRLVADAVATLLADDGRRGALVAAGLARPAELGLDRAASDLVEAVRGVAARATATATRGSDRPPGGALVRPGGPLSH